MKYILFTVIVASVFIGCKKDSETKPSTSTISPWYSFFNCTSLVNDSTKIGVGNYIYNSEVVETVNTLCIEAYKDSIGIRPVYTHYGLTYFYDVKTRWTYTQSIRDSYLNGIINGNIATITDTLTWIDTVKHTLIDAKLNMVSTKEVDLTYYEKINSNPVQYKHYIGKYFK